MGKFGYHVIDADGHGGEFANWQDTIPDALKPRLAEFREKIKKHYGRLPLPGGGQARPGDKFDIRPGMNDPKLRLTDMDEEGIDVTVTFPGGAGEEWAMLDPEFALALCQAPDQYPVCVDRFNTRLEVHAITHPVGNMIALDSFCIGGVFERFPKLRVAFMESGCGWLPFWLWRLDEHYEKMPEQAPKIRRKPSEYFHSNCWISCDPDEHMIPEVVKLIGDERIIYASDYYHWDCGFPDTVKMIAERNDLSEKTKKRIFADNAAKLYNL